MTLSNIFDALKRLTLEEKLQLYARLRADPRIRAFTLTDQQLQRRFDKSVKAKAQAASHLNRWRRRRKAMGLYETA